MLMGRQRSPGLGVVLLFVMLMAAWRCGGDQGGDRPASRSSQQRGEEAEAQLDEGLQPEEGEQSPAELRQKIDDLLAQLQRMETDLQRREARLEMGRRRLRAQQLELSEQRKAVGRLQRTAYVVLGLGLVSFLLGVVTFVRGRRQGASTEEPSPPAAGRRKAPSETRAKKPEAEETPAAEKKAPAGSGKSPEGDESGASRAVGEKTRKSRGKRRDKGAGDDS